MFMNVCASNCNCLCVWVKVFLKCVDMDSENNNMCTACYQVPSVVSKYSSILVQGKQHVYYMVCYEVLSVVSGILVPADQLSDYVQWHTSTS